MENKLKSLFDYQRFKGNEKLERLIVETESRYCKELSDDEMAFVSAAGDPFAEMVDREDNDDGSLA